MDIEGILKSFGMLLPGIVIGLTFHEFAHAKVADLLGDPTPGDQGRLTLNPLPHIDWIGFIMLALFHFGWAKPVQVSPWRFTHKVTMKTGMLLVALAGPAMNFFLAILGAIVYHILFPTTGLLEGTELLFLYFIQINVLLGVFNLIPIPPLDGSKILAGLLPEAGSKFIYSLEQYGPIILIVLIASRATNYIILPAVLAIFNLLV